MPLTAGPRLWQLSACDEPFLSSSFAPNLDWLAVFWRIAGSAVDVFATRVFAHAGQSGLGLFLT
jgi:hypothetical protein